MGTGGVLEKREERCRGTRSCYGGRVSIGTVMPDSVSYRGQALAWRY